MFLKSWFEKILRKEKGAILVMTAIAIPVLFGFAGLGFDVGNLYLHKGQLQHIADSAAYAGSSIYYKDMIDTSITEGLKPNADYVVNSEGTGVNPVSEAHNTRRIEADNAATEFVNRNRTGLQTEILALEGQVPIKTDSSSTHSTTTSDGVLYRVRVSEEYPLYFLPLIPGVAKTQVVSADAVVAFTRGNSTTATESTSYTTNYVNIFKNLFTTTNLSTGDYNGNGEVTDFIGNETLSSKIQSDIETADILDQFSYMIYLDNRSTSTYVFHDSKTLNAGNPNDKFYSGNSYSPYGYYSNRNYTSTLNGYYHPWDCNNYEYRRYHADVYLNKKLNNNNDKYVININKPLNNYKKMSDGEYVPLYLYKKYDGNVEINVTNNSARDHAGCFPIILVNRNQYIGPDYNSSNSTDRLYDETITVNISKDQIFRGLIFAPFATVTININKGTFKGGVVANNIIVNGQGSFIQENYFTESDGSDAWWIKNFIPEDSEKTYLNEDKTAFNEDTSATLDYFVNTYLKNMTYNLARQDGNGNSLDTWYTWVYETLKVGGNYRNGFGSERNRTKKNGGYIDLTSANTQNWFENLDTLSKARLAREWVNFIEEYKGETLTYDTGETYTTTETYWYKDKWGRWKEGQREVVHNITKDVTISDSTLPWVWSTNAEVHKEKEKEEAEVIKSYLMINSDDNTNLFKKFNL